MTTKEQIISDVQLQLNQGGISDDSQLDWNQLLYWGSYELNRLVTAECNAAIKSGSSIPAIYKKVADCEVISVEDVETFTAENDRCYVEIEDDILDLESDLGVIIVETEDGDLIKKTSLENFHRLKKMRFSKPSLSNTLCYRRGKKIFIPGFTPTDIPFEKVNVFYVPKQDLLAIADSAEVLVSDMTLPTLIDMMVERGKLMLYGTQPDIANDSADNKNVQYHTAIQNPAE
jgi:hypothetical protein